MTEEKKKPSKPDYTASAVQPTNAPEVKGLLDEWLAANKVYLEAYAEFEKVVDALPEKVKENDASKLKFEARTNLEVVIKEYGGYQDTELGLYALEQIRKSVSYDPGLVKELIPTFADKILAQVDVTVLKVCSGAS